MKTATATVLRASPVRSRYLDTREPYTPLSFLEINEKARGLADLIEHRFDELADILLSYESFEVVKDEVARTLDLLRNLEENEKYFKLRVNEVTTFLPRNQPLYTFACFVIIPSLMASEVHFRIPHSMRHFFPQILRLLEISLLFPNVIVSNQTRLDFLRSRSALRVNPVTNETIPVTDVVIFTGTPAHASQLRVIFDTHTLFISNGSGHNPVVVSDNADIPKAVESVLGLQLYNQGQDCSAPNAVLVHARIFADFQAHLREELKKIPVGTYRDQTNRVGPISDPKDLVRILDLIVDNQEYLDPTTPGIVRARDGILEPTIISKPLKNGGNVTEIFAPVIFLQEYDDDAGLALYFENPLYAYNAMFITLFGTSNYISQLVDRPIAGKILQNQASILSNSDPHAFGVERGTQPYGGLGLGASSLSINGKIYAKPTLPQRDIYEWIAKPLLARKDLQRYRANLKLFSKVSRKNVEKLLRLTSEESGTKQVTVEVGTTYVDIRALKPKKTQRYTMIDEKHAYHLLTRPNGEYIAQLKPLDIVHLRELKQLLRRRASLSREKFTTLLYAIPLKKDGSKRENRALQLRFFQHVYQLLLNEKFGPRLPQFLAEIDAKKMRALLDV